MYLVSAEKPIFSVSMHAHTRMDAGASFLWPFATYFCVDKSAARKEV